MTRLRRHVPQVCSLGLTLACLIASSGCYLSYGLSGAERDAGGALSDAAMSDAAMSDAGSDAGLSCPAVRADYVCLESFLVQPGRAFSLPLSFATCGCCVHSECAVGVDASTHTLSLTTALCADTCACDACNTPTVSCEVPPLAEGDWTVNVNGGDAFALPVRYDSGLVPPPPACVDFAQPSLCPGDRALPGLSSPVALACATQDGLGRDAYVLEVTDPCGGCSSDSACTVQLDPRYTDDLPPGGELTVMANRYFPGCVDCTPGCVPVTRVCPVPPLVPGDVYRVHVEGVPPFIFTAGTDARVCAGGPIGL